MVPDDQDIARVGEEPANAAQDAQTITEVIKALESEGYAGQLRAVENTSIECFTCREISPAADFAVEKMARLEGPTDPSDMVAVAAVTCPRCATRGTLLLGYGPDSTIEDADALQALG